MNEDSIKYYDALNSFKENYGSEFGVVFIDEDHWDDGIIVYVDNINNALRLPVEHKSFPIVQIDVYNSYMEIIKSISEINKFLNGDLNNDSYLFFIKQKDFLKSIIDKYEKENNLNTLKDLIKE